MNFLRKLKRRKKRSKYETKAEENKMNRKDKNHENIPIDKSGETLEVRKKPCHINEEKTEPQHSTRKSREERRNATFEKVPGEVRDGLVDYVLCKTIDEFL